MNETSTSTILSTRNSKIGIKVITKIKDGMQLEHPVLNIQNL